MGADRTTQKYEQGELGDLGVNTEDWVGGWVGRWMDDGW